MILLFAFLLAAEAAAPPAPEPAAELPSAATIRSRRVVPNHPQIVEGHILTPGDTISADDVMDEILDEFAADIARLGANGVGPILLERVHMSENMNPAYAHVLEARLVTAVFRAANVAMVRCVECWATRGRVEEDAWVVSRGITRRDELQSVAKKYGARTFLDVSLTLRDRPSQLGMDVELVRADDSSIAFAESYRMDADQALLYRGADKAQKREARLKELEDRLERRPRFGHEAQLGMMRVDTDNSGAVWGGLGRYALTEQFGEDRGIEAGLLLGGFVNTVSLAGGLIGVQFASRLGPANDFGPEWSLYGQGTVFITGTAGNTPIFGGGLRFLAGSRIALRAGANYMVPFQLRGKGDTYGGFCPEIGMSFVWR